MLERYVGSLSAGLIPKLLINSKVQQQAARPHICFAKRGANAVSHGVLSLVCGLFCTEFRLSQAKLSAAVHTQTRILTKQLLALAASRAVLGPLCDGQHTRFGVLRYTSPSVITLPGSGWQLETCWYHVVLVCLLCM